MKWAFLIILAVLTVAICPWLGDRSLPFSVLSTPFATDVESVILWQIRLPRVILSLLAGAALSLGGVAFQAMFRNPLATPYTLGVAGGASFMVALWLKLGLTITFLGISGVSLAALLGAILAIVLLYLLVKLIGVSSSMTMILGGVVMSFLFSSLIMLLQFMMDIGDSFRIVHWLMGDLAGASVDSVLQVLPFVVSGALILLFMRDELNLLALGEELAASRGVSIEKTRMVLFFAVSLMIAGVISVCGPIGFVGIIAPHISRLLIGSNYRNLIPFSALFGAVFLCWCDTVARLSLTNAELPVGVVTALLGGPFFLSVLFKRHRTLNF